MHFGMRSDRFPRMYTYSDAVRKEAEIKPLRGKHAGDKPLAERRRTNLTIRKVERLHGQIDIVVRLYGTDIITYRPNGEIVVEQGGYNTPTTHETIARILNTTIYQRHGEGWVDAKNGTYILRRRGVNVFERDVVSDGLLYVNPVYPVKHTLKLKDYNRVKKQYAAFTKYAVGLAKMCDEQTMRGVAWSDMPNTEEATRLMLSEDTEDNYKAFLIAHALRDRYLDNLPEAIKRSIHNLIKTHHKDEVFEATIVHTGRVVKDANGYYF